MVDRRHAVSIAIAGALAWSMAATVPAQEIAGGGATTTAKPMSGNLVPITQPMLNAAGGDPKNWIHANGSYEQTRYYTADVERGIAYDDPQVAVQWPLPADEIQVSERDATGPKLADVADDLPFVFAAD